MFERAVCLAFKPQNFIHSMNLVTHSKITKGIVKYTRSSRDKLSVSGSMTVLGTYSFKVIVREEILFILANAFIERKTGLLTFWGSVWL